MEWTSWLFIAFAVIIGVLYAVFFIKKRYAYQLCLSVWAFSTLFQYLSNNRIFIIVLSVIQIVLAMLTFFFLFHSKKDRMNKLYKKMAEQATQDLPANSDDQDKVKENQDEGQSETLNQSEPTANNVNIDNK